LSATAGHRWRTLSPCAGTDLFGRDALDNHLSTANADHIKPMGSRVRQIDDAIVQERAAIIDSHDDTATV
jgi:hypothetical protein